MQKVRKQVQLVDKKEGLRAAVAYLHLVGMSKAESAQMLKNSLDYPTSLIDSAIRDHEVWEEKPEEPEA